MLSLCCSTHYALMCYVLYTTTLSNLLYIWWKARVLLLPWYSFGRRPTKAVSPLSLAPLPQNNTLAYSSPSQNEWIEIVSTLLRVFQCLFKTQTIKSYIIQQNSQFLDFTNFVKCKETLQFFLL